MAIKIQLPTPRATIAAKDIAVKLRAAPPEPATITSPTKDILLDNEEEAFSASATLSDKLANIDSLLSVEGLPIERLRAGLKDVMQCIKNVEGSIMELEPSDIRMIVQGYIKCSDREIATIVQGKGKTTAKKATARLAKIAKEENLEEVDF
jgi:hypothetical protein